MKKLNQWVTLSGEDQDLLQATLDSSLEMIQVFKAVRNEAGEIVDFCWILINAMSEKVFGDVVGKSLLERNPGVVQEGIFANFVEVVNTGVARQYERHYVYEQFDGWFHQSVVKLDDGVATSTLDITERKVAEQQVAKLEAERQLEIFKATLASQEEERKRISENLHNGLGQLLYGIKISLGQLSPELAKEKPELYRENKLYTEQLVTQAISEGRLISHQLTPTMLQELGLNDSVYNICRQLSDKVTFSCQINIGERLEKYLELAVFRIVQELMVNVVKHAHATKAHVMIDVRDGKVLIAVNDNGVGFDISTDKRSGIGLTSIRTKTKLLNGEMQVLCHPGETKVVVTLPLPHLRIALNT